MPDAKRSFAALALFAAVGMSACGNPATPTVHPSATLQAVPGSRAGRIVLTPLGAQRIGVQTAVVRGVPAPRPDAPKVIIPYASVIYAPDGTTFAFINPSPLVFTEVPVTIARIEAGSAYLVRGPAAGAKVVTTGAEELFGVQTGVLPQT